MSGCCHSKCDDLVELRGRQRNVLQVVLVINLVMFFVEFSYGLYSNSTSLMADSLDMLGDATVYAFSLFVLSRSMKWKAGAAILKGAIITFFGISVVVDVAFKLQADVVPIAHTMGAVGLVALAANALCLYLLTRHKDDDINMKSTWICSRNDIIANTGVIIVAGCVSFFNSKWPDIIFGGVMAIVFLKSAVVILKDAIVEFKKSE